MKNVFALIFFIPNFCFGQTTIDGHFKTLLNKSFTIKTDQTSLNDFTGINISQGTTNANGQFTSTFQLPAEQPVTLFIGKIFLTLWTKPHTTLRIEEKTDGQYVFTGTSATENNFLYSTMLMQPYKVLSTIEVDNFEPQKHLNYLDSIEENRLIALAELSKKKNISKEFISYCQAEIKGFTYFDKNQYPALLKSMNKIDEANIPDNYFNFWEKFKLENDSTLSTTYQSALQNFIEFKTLKRVNKIKPGTEKFWQEYFITMKELLKNHPFTLQKQMTSAIVLLIKYFNFSQSTALQIERYKKQFPTSASIPLIEKLWNAKIISTTAIPSFRLKNTANKWVDIKDFRGKVVYIDFWGSWCKACINNMTHAEVLTERFRNKDVVFLYLNFYDTKEKWLKAIQKYKIKGIHLKAEKTDEVYFNNTFNIAQGFPRYALIDKKGNLITISAPQPQEPSAYDFIDKYLTQ